jgi:ribosomal protein S18 acetylase RimI-like enzyme
MQIRPFLADDEAQVVDLWQRCGLVVPWNDPHQDIARKMDVQPELFLVGVRDGEVIATVMAGYDGHRGWLNYVAVAPEQQGQGLGRAIVGAAIAALRERGCAKINLQVRTSNAAVIAFYRQLGFSIDDVIGMGKRL